MTSSGVDGNELAAPRSRARGSLLPVSWSHFGNVYTHRSRRRPREAWPTHGDVLTSRAVTCTLRGALVIRREGGRARSVRSHVGAPSHFDAVYFLSSPATEAALKTRKTPQTPAGGAAGLQPSGVCPPRGSFFQGAEASEQRCGQTGTAEPAARKAALQTSPGRNRLAWKGTTRLWNTREMIPVFPQS